MSQLDSDDETESDYAARMDAHQEALHDLVVDYAEKHDLDDAELLMQLVQLTLSLTSMSYGLSTSRPSAAGLRAHLDRLHKAFGEAVRSQKKAADEIVANLREMLEFAEGGEQPDADRDR